MAQVEAWLQSGDVQRLVVVVSGVDSLETLERWQFNVALEDDNGAGSGSKGDFRSSDGGENQPPNAELTKAGSDVCLKKCSNRGIKSMQEINGEIQAIIRQITASVTFLPLLNEPCSFDLLVYTKKDTPAPTKWEDSDPCYIMNSQEVKLRSFTTTVRLEMRMLRLVAGSFVFSQVFLSSMDPHVVSFVFLSVQSYRFIRSTPWSPTEKRRIGNSRKTVRTCDCSFFLDRSLEKDHCHGERRKVCAKLHGTIQDPE